MKKELKRFLKRYLTELRYDLAKPTASLPESAYALLLPVPLFLSAKMSSIH
jgi:hypothetical protein